MSWEFDGDTPPEAKDRTKLVWGAIFAALGVMAIGLWAISSRPSVGQSRAYVKHILIAFDARDATDRDRALELANDLRERILSGEASFEEIADDYSAESTKGKPGHLGWMTVEDTVKGAAEDFIWDGPVGELSPVIESNVGFHLIFVSNRILSEREIFEREIERKVFGDGNADETQ